jgi:NADPH-dependent methylglyoxal reductase
MSAEIILLTGANGYLALHIIQQALEKNWTIVGTVRSEAAATKIRALFPNAGSKLSLVRITELTSANSFESAFRDHRITAAINAASPLVHEPEDAKRDVVDPAIKGGIAILTAAKLYGGTALRRVVHVGSCSSCLDHSKGDAPGKTYSSEDWNPTTYEEAMAGDSKIAYFGSKALTERAMWDYMSREKPTFKLTTVLPAGIFGPHLGYIDMKNLNVSSQIIWGIAVKSDSPAPYSDIHFGCWVDVRDTARAILLAVDAPAAGGERFIIAQRTHWQFIRDAARAVNDEMKSRVDPGTPGAGDAAKDTTYDIDGSKAERILGLKYTTLEESLRDSYTQLLNAEKTEQTSS